MMSCRILIAAGGTGGHLFPAQQLCQELQKLGGVEILLAGHGLDKSPYLQGAWPFVEISSAPLSPKRTFLGKTGKGIWKGLQVLRSFDPDLVVGFGSFHTFSMLFAALLKNKPFVLFEPNRTLGRVNRFFAPFAKQIAVQWPLMRPLKKESLVPLLPWGFSQEGVGSREEARQFYGLNSDWPTILVFGGSQGAAFFNTEVPEALRSLQERGERLQVLHLSGSAPEPVMNRYAQRGIVACVRSFETQMHRAYLAADLVLCRGGASSLAELIRYQKPALIIPYPYATESHQEKNGQYFQQTLKGGLCLAQKQASCETLCRYLQVLWEQKTFYQSQLEKTVQGQGDRPSFASLLFKQASLCQKNRSIT